MDCQPLPALLDQLPVSSDLRLIERHQPVHFVHFGPRLNPHHSILGRSPFSSLHFDSKIQAYDVVLPLFDLRLILILAMAGLGLIRQLTRFLFCYGPSLR